MPTPIKWSSEFIVNTTTRNDQGQPSVTALAGGGFVVAWSDASAASAPGGSTDVRLQVFSADGRMIGNEIVVPADPAGEQVEPSVAALPDGGFAVVWTGRPPSNGPGGASGGDVMLQRFAADGTRVGPEEVVNTVTVGAQGQPVVAARPDGSLVVAWTSRPDGGTTDVKLQVFDADGLRVGDERDVQWPDDFDQTDPSLAVLATGEVFLTWTDRSVNSYYPNSTGEVMGARIDDRGYPSLGPFALTGMAIGQQAAHSVTGLADGGYVVAWSSLSDAPIYEASIRAQAFNSDGTPRGQEIAILAGAESTQWEPRVAALPDGTFVFAWLESSRSGTSLLAQAFGRDGQPLGASTEVKASFFAMLSPSLTVLADGRVVATWADGFTYGMDMSGSGIKAVILDTRTAAVTLNGTTLDDDLVGTAFADLLSGSEGRDRLTGAGGDDQFWGEEGDDSLGGDFGNDRLWGGEGNDVLNGGAGSDRLHGGEGDDALDGGLGSDRLEGGLGDDTFVIDSAGDRVVERVGEGSDTIATGTRSVSLADFANVENVRLLGESDLSATGTAAANRLEGNDGDNALLGGAGNDWLEGGLGDDRLRGGSGHDRLLGGADADVFVFDRRGGRDVVLDFEDGVDRLDLQAFDFASVRAVRAVATQTGDDLVLKLAAGVTVTLHDMTKAELDANDLIL